LISSLESNIEIHGGILRMKNDKKSRFFQHGIIIFIGIFFICGESIGVSFSKAQIRQQQQTSSNERRMPAQTLRPERRALVEESSIIDRAIISICEQSAQDPYRTNPIDQMALQRELPLTDSQVIARKKRAEKLLPIAKRLLPTELSRLAAAYNLEETSFSWILTRLKAVSTIKMEVELHDNAVWRSSEPHAIVFGTVFLNGLKSDEALITVLAHELTHAINGKDKSLQPLFMRIGARVSEIRKMPVPSNIAAELTCELVGLQVMREHTAGASSKDNLRRLARAMGKNCVQWDLADETHLSPRETLRTLLLVEPELTKAMVVSAEKKYLHKSKKWN
jgi:hypothetical protein